MQCVLPLPELFGVKGHPHGCRADPDFSKRLMPIGRFTPPPCASTRLQAQELSPAPPFSMNACALAPWADLVSLQHRGIVWLPALVRNQFKAPDKAIPFSVLLIITPSSCPLCKPGKLVKPVEKKMTIFSVKLWCMCHPQQKLFFPFCQPPMYDWEC